MRRIFLVLTAFIFAAGAAAAELQVCAAASLTDALQEIGNAFGRAHHVTVRFNFAASSTLAMQIREGAPADVFVSADELQVDALERNGLVVRGSRRTVASNALVIVVPADSAMQVPNAAALAAGTVRRIAIADPQRVPAGVYARNYLQRVSLWPRIAPNVIPTENVRGALAAVEAGNADAGIVYRTDAMISRKVKVAAVIGGPDAPAISYPAAVLSQAGSQAVAAQFVNYLTSEPARRIFRRYGFIVN